jgi:hypothetical protein
MYYNIYTLVISRMTQIAYVNIPTQPSGKNGKSKEHHRENELLTYIAIHFRTRDSFALTKKEIMCQTKE